MIHKCKMIERILFKCYISKYTRVFPCTRPDYLVSPYFFLIDKIDEPTEPPFLFANRNVALWTNPQRTHKTVAVLSQKRQTITVWRTVHSTAIPHRLKFCHLTCKMLYRSNRHHHTICELTSRDIRTKSRKKLRLFMWRKLHILWMRVLEFNGF